MLELRPGDWYHTVTLPDGRRTPGLFDHAPILKHIRWPESLRGGRCLDVGTFDGFWAFEMEKAGAAEVVGLDVADPADYDWHWDQRSTGPATSREWRARRTGGFNVLAPLLNSSVRQERARVYDLDPAQHGMFDVVLCGDVLLHLRDPVLALERMRSVCRGTLVLVETLEPALELFRRRWPAAFFAPDHDQWWRCNATCLRRMVEVAGFEVTWTSRRFVLPLGEAVDKRLTLWQLLNRLAGRSLRQAGLLHVALHARPLSDPAS